MSWAKVDDRLFGHTKAARAGEALWLWVVALSWCCAYLTDGEVPEEVPRRLIGRKGPRYAARLVEVKLWEKTEFGYRFRSWSEYQTTRETVEASRAEAKARMQRIRGVAGNVRANNSVGSPDVRPQFAACSPAVRDAKSESESESDTESNTEKREETPPDGGVARVREDAPAAPAREGLTLSADTPAVERKRAARRAKPAPAPDPTPDPSSPAGRVYSAIVGDAALAPITRGPGDLAVRLVALCEGTGVDPLREVLALGAWLAGGGTWTDGRAGLLRAIKRKIDDAARLPKPATGSSMARAPERIDYQGRRVVGSAGLPPGSAWEKTRAEFEAEEDRIYADFVERTQPRRVK